jgi:capsular polysaccharide transport system permease protein
MTIAQLTGTAWQTFARHRRIIWALSLRELVTRYGREHLGFLWVIFEPLLFCAAVSALWTAIRPTYEHGIRITAFVVTGYMPILLVRHILIHGMYAVRVNAPLLYHRQITVVHMFFARAIVETVGVTFAFVLIGFMLVPLGLLPLPENLLPLYGGWFFLACMAWGLMMTFGSLFEVFEPVERVVNVISYIMVPLSGTFFMAAWVPARYRDIVLYMPFLNCIEMIRSAFFSDAAHFYYSLPYVIASAAGFLVVGLVTTTFVRRRVFIE